MPSKRSDPIFTGKPVGGINPMFGRSVPTNRKGS